MGAGEPAGVGETACIDCMQSIPNEAAKCPSCGSFQDWRRHLQFSGTVLSLLVALISVSTVLVSALIDMTRSERSRLVFELIDTTIVANWFVPSSNQEVIAVSGYKVELRLLAANVGEKTGLLRSVKIHLERLGSPIADANLKVDPEVTVLEPGTLKLHEFFGELELRGTDALPTGQMRKDSRPKSVQIEAGQVVIEVVHNNLEKETRQIPIGTEAWEINFSVGG